MKSHTEGPVKKNNSFSDEFCATSPSTQLISLRFVLRIWQFSHVSASTLPLCGNIIISAPLSVC